MSMIDRVVVSFLSAAASRKNEEGQGLAEYALILALVAILCIVALGTLKNGITGTLGTVANAL